MSQDASFHEDLARTGRVEQSSDRAFGVVFAAVFTVIAAWPLLHGGGVRVWSLVVAGVFLGTALVYPPLLRPLSRVWLWIGSVLHRIVSPIVLAVVFFLVVLPTGLLMRLFGKRTVPTGADPDRDSYWILRDPPGPPPAGMKNQF